MQHRKYSPDYCLTTAQFHSSCDLRREQQNDEMSFFLMMIAEKNGRFITRYKTVLDNEKITQDTFNNSAMSRAF